MIKTVCLWILISIVLSQGTVQSQNPFNQFKVDHWDTKKGLPNDLILNLLQGKDGFLWLTSYSGLTRFDGISFTAFNSGNTPLMKTDNVEKLAEGEDSSIWIPTPSSGLLCLKNGVFTAYLKNYYSLLLLAGGNNGDLLLGTGRSTNRFILFNTRSKKHVELTDAQRQQFFGEGKLTFKNGRDKDGDQWGNFFTNLVRIHQGRIQVLGKNEGILPGVTYQNFFVDTKKRVWLTSNKGLFLWNGKTMSPYPGMEDKVFLTSNITSGLILEDRHGGIWAACVSGLAYMPSGADRFSIIPEKHPLRSQNITNFLEDREGNIWLSSETGLYKLSYSKFINYSDQDGIFNNRVSGVCAIDSNHYLFSSLGKLYNVDHGVVKPYIFKNKELSEAPYEFLHFLRDSKNVVWACGSNIVKISSAKEEVIHTEGPVRFAFEDKDKKIWFGLPYKGIVFLNDQGKPEYLKFPLVDFKTLFISSIRKLISGNWLVTTYNTGIVIIDNSGRPTMFKDTTGLPVVGIFGSWEDPDGTVWFTTQSGISRYKNGVFSNIGIKERIPDNAVFDFLPDHEGYIWLPSNKGLMRVAKQELTDYLDKKITQIHWKIYDDGDGMLNRQCVGARHGTVTPGGKILAPTFGGLVEVDPQKLTTNRISPPVVIHRVLKDSSSVALAPGSVFEPGNHRYIFEYSGLSLVAPEKVQFKFKLTGYDKNWITAVGDRKAFYTNLPAGDYTFRVIASNNDGIWNETGASFRFTILPFFYETAWFRIGMIALLLLFVWAMVRWRTGAVRKQNELLESQVNARTTDLKKVNLELNQSNAAIAEQRDNLEKTLRELKSAQSQLIHSEKMASLGELTAGIAHEIQNPLNFVNNFSEVNKELLEEMKLEIDKGNTGEVKTIADGIIENEEKITYHGKRADAIVKSMLQHSRTSSGVKELTDINALADEYLRLAYLGMRGKDKSFNATMKTDFDETIGKINIIPQDIGRVLLNLYNNAFYAATLPPPTGGRFPDPDYKHEPTVWVNTKKIEDKVFISVKDNGPGIPQDIVDKIFQPFFTTKPAGQGTGLGLSLTYDIIKAHGGEIKVETSQDTSFIIVLPLKS